MAQIVINEISQNYTYNIGSNSFATVALPITAMWGPAYGDPIAVLGEGSTSEDMLEQTTWQHFPATQAGLESFVATYRGPESNFRMCQDYSYQMAMTLLTAGYDVLVCRVCPGTVAECQHYLNESDESKYVLVKAKYPGSFGNQLKVVFKKITKKVLNTATQQWEVKPYYWNAVVYVCDSTGIQTAVENLIFVFDMENSTDTIPHISELESKFIILEPNGIYSDDIDIVSGAPSNDAIYGLKANQEGWFEPLTAEPDDWDNAYNSNIYAEKAGTGAIDGVIRFIGVQSPGYGQAPTFVSGKYYKMSDVSVMNQAILEGGTDLDGSVTDKAELISKITTLAKDRYTVAGYGDVGYTTELNTAIESIDDINKLRGLYHMEWVYTAACSVYDLLKDKLNYNPQRIISPGWDDQDIRKVTGEYSATQLVVSPIHKKLLEVAYYSRCGAGMIDIPRSCPRSLVYNDDNQNPGYAQLLSREEIAIGGNDVNAVLFNTHCGLYAPWGQYKYVGMGKQCIAPPSFLALLIMRAMILNQSLQYEWALPTNRKHNLNIGKMDYKVPKKLLDVWQKLEGVGVNVITEIPELGLSVWGNSTLYEVPPATYQALANMSTRYLVNAVEDVAYKCGLAITFQYNNEQAYNKFYAGVTPLLDTMKNVGAIDDYYVKMAADINGLDQVNANTVIGKIYLVINGVINDIIIDLIALPPGVDLNQYKS